MDDKAKENWGSAGPYALYVGRWSRKIAVEFLDWIGVPQKSAWADVGCGTGALTQCILDRCDSRSIAAIDKADGFVATARQTITDPRVMFGTGDATKLPWENRAFDAVVSALVLNFVPDSKKMLSEMARVTKRGGKVAAYVWDYAGGMEMMRRFWDAAIAISPGDSKLDQAERFPICQPEPLTALFIDNGLQAVSVRSIEIPTIFKNFDDYWVPFLGKQGAAPTYLASVTDEIEKKFERVWKAVCPDQRTEQFHYEQGPGPSKGCANEKWCGRSNWMSSNRRLKPMLL
jgi:trans-aconitate methyltransferase